MLDTRKVTCYTYEGDVVNGMGYEYDYPHWNAIVPETVGESMYDAAFRNAK